MKAGCKHTTKTPNATNRKPESSFRVGLKLAETILDLPERHAESKSQAEGKGYFCFRLSHLGSRFSVWGRGFWFRVEGSGFRIGFPR